MNKWILAFVLSMMGFGLSAQSIPESEIILFKKQRYFGANINTFGYGATSSFGKYKEAKKIRLIGVDFQIVKHEKEIKSPPLNNPAGRMIIYGKQNSFFILRATFGKKYVVAEKLRRSGVQVAYNWQVGPVFGFTKPVYLEIQNPDSDNGVPLIEKFDVDKHYANILGRASGFYGLNELKFYPGLTFKFAMNFEYSNERERLKGIETGISFDAFGKRIPIMAEKVLKEDISNPRNHQAFFALYLNLFFGTKYDQK